MRLYYRVHDSIQLRFRVFRGLPSRFVVGSVNHGIHGIHGKASATPASSYSPNKQEVPLRMQKPTSVAILSRRI